MAHAPQKSGTHGLRGRGLAHRFGTRSTHTRDVFADVDVHVASGEMVGLVGPSGVGKSTLARILCAHVVPTAGLVELDGVPLPTRRGRLLADVALVGQNPREATDPRWTLRRIIAEPGAITGGVSRDGCHQAVDAAAEQCFLEPALLDRHPHEVSAGQLQRACLARALVQQPRFLVCDEPTSMLDPITTAGIMRVVRTLIEQGAGAMLISHDHRLVAACADRVLQMEADDSGPARLTTWAGAPEPAAETGVRVGAGGERAL